MNNKLKSFKTTNLRRKSWNDSRRRSFPNQRVERLGIKPLKMSDGPMGVREDFQNGAWMPLNQTDDYSTYYRAEVPLLLPGIIFSL